MEPRKVRLLRLALLQIAILSIGSGCRYVAKPDVAPEHTATSRLDSGRLVEVPK